MSDNLFDLPESEPPLSAQRAKLVLKLQELELELEQVEDIDDTALLAERLSWSIHKTKAELARIERHLYKL